MSRRSGIATKLISALLLAIPACCCGAESYWLTAQKGKAASFYLIGGNYSLYVHAQRPATYSGDPASRSCFFYGNFQRVWPTHDAMHVGTVIPISTIVPYKLGPADVNLPGGLYALYITSQTNCNWKFILTSTANNPAGIAPVAMGLPSTDHQHIIDTAALGATMQFYAQCRSANDQNLPASGTAELIHDGTVFFTGPLQIARDANLGDCFFVNLTFSAEDKKYVGKNTVRFKVKIGSDEFTSTGEFTLTD